MEIITADHDLKKGPKTLLISIDLFAHLIFITKCTI